MNQLVSISLARPARWLIKPNAPVALELTSIPGWSALNPIAVNTMFGEKGRRGDERFKVVGIHDNAALVESTEIPFFVDSLETLFLVDRPSTLLEPAPLDRVAKSEWILSYYIPVISQGFIENLRFVTKQAGLHGSRGFGLSGVIRDDLVVNFPCASEKGNNLVDEYDVQTAITWDRLEEADKLGIPNQYHVYHSLIFDSLQALIDGDGRRALLYAAIAMETYINLSMADGHARLLGENASPESFRLVKSHDNEGQEVLKDPIFDYLSEKSRFDFRSRLHEFPLYVSGHSLLVDDEDLYREARRLYTTRNKIVHEGGPDELDGATFAMNLTDAKLGVKTALNVCAWFGMVEEYMVPGGGWVKVEWPSQNI